MILLLKPLWLENFVSNAKLYWVLMLMNKSLSE
jgi:hypothetical protein